jgi:hypothetical protein
MDSKLKSPYDHSWDNHLLGNMEHVFYLVMGSGREQRFSLHLTKMQSIYIYYEITEA